MPKKEKVRAELVKAARKAFTARGYTKATMEDIARAAGKAKSTLYYYFESKEDAFQAVVDFEGETLKAALMEIISDPQRSARKKIEDYILTRWQEFEELGNDYQTMRREFLENYDFVQKYRRQYDEVEMQLIGAILNQGIENKEFSIAHKDVEMVALTIVLSMKALEIPFFAKNNYKAIASKLKALIDVLFYGIVNSPPR
jgi:AcrR family transcriptional regulator